MRARTLFLILALGSPVAAAAQLNPLGGDFSLNPAPLHDRDGAVVALGPTGVTLAVWTVATDSPMTNELWERAFDAAGQPLGPGGRIDTGSFLSVSPAVVALPDGRFAVAWATSALVPASARHSGGGKIAPFGLDTISLRFVDGTGVPSGGEIRVDSAGASSATLRLAAVSTGVAVVWSEHDVFQVQDRAMARLFGFSGAPLGNEFQVDSSPSCSIAVLAVAGNRDGGVGVFWRSGDPATQGGCPGLRTRRFTSSGQPTMAALTVPDADLAAVRPDGSYLAVRNRLPPEGLPVASGYDVYVQLYDQNGVAQGDESSLTAPAPGDQKATDAVPGEGGDFVVVWSGDGEVTAQLLDESGHRVGSPTPVNAQTVGNQLAPRAATDDHGEWVISWVSEAPGQTGGNLFARHFSESAPACGFALCLNGGRFGVNVAWRDPRSGATGNGHGELLTGDGGDTGAFWFFSAENVELFVKVLDGSSVNGHFWVFFGGLSDVEFTLSVTDTASGTIKTYHSPAYTLASHADTLAFVASAASAQPSSTAGLHRLAAPHGTDTTAACLADGASLCLGGERFRISVAWTDPRTGATGSGQAVPLGGASGYFWFFNADNVEMVVKVLDGRAVNGHFWVFDAALTDVETAITVTDTATGAFKIYRKPAFKFASQADTAAF